MNKKQTSINASIQSTVSLPNEADWVANSCNPLCLPPMLRWQRQLLLMLAGVLCTLLLVNSPAQAAAITADGATCTLVDAITAANTDTATNGCAAGSGDDTITLTAAVTLTVANNGDNGLPVINSTITIEGNGYPVKRDGSAGNFRILQVGGGGKLTLNQSMISGGNTSSQWGGGGIYIAETGTLTVTNSTISNNTAASLMGGTGGGISSYGGTLTVINSTISGNTAADGMMDPGAGGGIYNSTFNFSPANVMISNSTITGNAAAGSSGFGGGGGIFAYNGSVALVRTLVAGNISFSNREIYTYVGTITSNNYNLIGYNSDAGSDGFTPSGTDIVPSVGLAAILSATLADNGGDTFTHALIRGSPAIDAATDSSLATDQRGVARPQGAADDIGAFEAPTLVGLVLAAGTLTPSFDAIVISYTATVANAINSVSITPTVSEINAGTIITVTPAGGTPVTCTGTPVACPLAVGNNVVEVHVTSPDGTIVKTYTTTITRSLSPDATLSGLAIGTGTLTPSFDANVITYTAMVTSATSSVSITPTVNEINASVIVTVTPAGGIPVTCTGSPIDCPLVIGDNVIVVTVTAQDGTIKTYTSTVTRPSTDATLSDLSIGVGTLAPSFDPNTTSYTTTVGNATSRVGITATTNEGNASTVVTVTPPGGTPITCNGNPLECPLAVGANVIEVTVTAQDGTTTKTYTTTVTRALSPDATLRSLAIGTGTLAPTFDPNTTSYTTTVGKATSSVSVTLATNEGNASTVVTVTPLGGSPITCNGNPVECPLAVGANVIEVTVTAQDGTTSKIYTTTVARALSPDATLRGLAIGTGTLTPSFDTNIVSYTAMVGNATSSVSVTLATNEDNASTVVTVTPPGGSPITCTGDPVDCPLAEGDNAIEVTVTAQDGTIKIYTITVTREPLDTDGDSIPNSVDQDDDGDGLPDSVEGNGAVDTDGDGIADSLDLDSDNDGINDVREVGGLTDGNGDGKADGTINAIAFSASPATTPVDTDNDGTPDYRDLDSDGDGISDLLESAATGLIDTNNDSVVDGPDNDGDGIQQSADGNDDGVGDNSDPVLADTDSDGAPDAFDIDSDNDGKSDQSEGAGDVDGDGIPSYADANDNDGPLGDMDGDGLTNAREGGAQIDTDGDGIPDYLDADDDGDGILTKDEDINQDGNLDNDDSNGNGIPDYLDSSGKTYVYWLPVISRTSQVTNSTDK